MVLEKLKSVQIIPIFPLPAVLVPGMVMPLHIFEPRYRAMVQRSLETDNLFGLSYHPDAAVDEATPPAPGSVGCAAQIVTISRLPDGRSNLLAVGLDRYEVVAYEQEEPFLIAQVDFFDDEEISQVDPGVQELMRDLRVLFDRYSAAAISLGEMPRPRVEPPEEPQPFSFAVALAVVQEAAELQRLLEMRSTRQRLEDLEALIGSTVDQLERRAAERKILSGNGHRKSKPGS